jgi:hypothetical protein
VAYLVLLSTAIGNDREWDSMGQVLYMKGGGTRKGSRVQEFKRERESSRVQERERVSESSERHRDRDTGIVWSGRIGYLQMAPSMRLGR